MSTSYYRGAHGIIIAYDITDRASFVNIESWWNEISKETNKEVCAILVGNKNDLQGRAVSFEEGRRLAERYGIPFMETSAKSGANVQEVFYEMTNIILDTSDLDRLRSTRPSRLRIPRPKTNDNKNCCC